MWGSLAIVIDHSSVYENEYEGVRCGVVCVCERGGVSTGGGLTFSTTIKHSQLEQIGNDCYH